MLPPMRLRRREGEAFQFRQRLGQHRWVVLWIDNRIAPAIVDDQAGREVVVAEPTTTFPANVFGNATIVLAVDDLL